MNPEEFSEQTLRQSLNAELTKLEPSKQATFYEVSQKLPGNSGESGRFNTDLLSAFAALCAIVAAIYLVNTFRNTVPEVADSIQVESTRTLEDSTDAAPISAPAALEIPIELPDSFNLDFENDLSPGEGIWKKRGTVLYAFERDETTATSGNSSLHFFAKEESPVGGGTIALNMTADHMRSKRVRVSADIQTGASVESAALFLGVDDNKGNRLQFDNMMERRIYGATDWTQYDIVFEVPEDASYMFVGLYIMQSGSAHIDNIRFVEVPDSVALTTSLPSTPSNLDFETGDDAWFIAGLDPLNYASTVTSAHASNGDSSLQVESLNSGGVDATSIMQMFSAETMLGQRIRLSADIRTEGSLDSSRLWVDVSEDIREIDFETTQFAEVSAIAEWTPYSVVFDIPEDSQAINFGLELSGEGLVWLDNVRFEVISAETPITSPSSDK